jgi:hypothetical protein
MPVSLPCRFITVEGETIGPTLDLPSLATTDKLEKLVNQLVASEAADEEQEAVPYAFYIGWGTILLYCLTQAILFRFSQEY